MARVDFLTTVQRIAEQGSLLKFVEADSLQRRLRELESLGETARRVLAKETLKEALDDLLWIDRLLGKVESSRHVSLGGDLAQWRASLPPTRQYTGVNGVRSERFSSERAAEAKTRRRDHQGLCMHSLRAIKANNALGHQAAIAKIRAWLGHKNIATIWPDGEELFPDLNP